MNEATSNLTGWAAIGAALVEAQAQCKPVAKSGRSPDGYEFARADDVIAAGRAALNAAGMALLPTRLDVVEFCGGLAVQRTMTLFHRSGANVVLEVRWPIYIAPGKPRDKAVAAGDTSALAYCYRDLLGIDRVVAGEVPMDARPDEDQAQGETTAPAPGPSQTVRAGRRPPYMRTDKPDGSALSEPVKEAVKEAESSAAPWDEPPATDAPLVQPTEAQVAACQVVMESVEKKDAAPVEKIRDALAGYADLEARTTAERVAAWRAAKLQKARKSHGVCVLCGLEIQSGDSYRRKPDGAVAHDVCVDELEAGRDPKAAA